MSVTMLVSLGIAVAASLGIVAAGIRYEWDVTSRSYARWTRAIGVFAVVGMAAVVAWGRREEPAVAALVLVGGVALSAGFVLLHRNLEAKIRAALNDARQE